MKSLKNSQFSVPELTKTEKLRTAAPTKKGLRERPWKERSSGQKSPPQTPRQIDLSLILAQAMTVGRFKFLAVKGALSWGAFYTELRKLGELRKAFDVKWPEQGDV